MHFVGALEPHKIQTSADCPAQDEHGGDKTLHNNTTLYIYVYMHIDAYSVYMCLHFVGDRFFRVDPLSSWVCAASGKGLHDTATASAPQSAEA